MKKNTKSTQQLTATGDSSKSIFTRRNHEINRQVQTHNIIRRPNRTRPVDRVYRTLPGKRHWGRYVDLPKYHYSDRFCPRSGRISLPRHFR